MSRRLSCDARDAHRADRGRAKRACCAAPSSPRTREDTPEYRVVGVASDDTLNLRSEPDHESDILRQIPNDAAGIVGTGRKETVDGETWIEVIYDNEKGWVNSRYVAGLSRANQAGWARRSERDKVPRVTD